MTRAPSAFGVGLFPPKVHGVERMNGKAAARHPLRALDCGPELDVRFRDGLPVRGDEHAQSRSFFIEHDRDRLGMVLDVERTEHFFRATWSGHEELARIAAN